jgi:osmotically-inducible protein OsmY
MTLDYLEAHIREALATDPRTNILDPQITIAAGKVFLLATVESEERRLAVERVVRDVIGPDVELVNEICVDCFDTATTTEERI